MNILIFLNVYEFFLKILYVYENTVFEKNRFLR